MKKNWLRGLLLGVSLALVVGGGVALAQDVEPANGPPPEPPTSVQGVYVTTEDNENNAGTGEADGDMGPTEIPLPFPYPWICPQDENAPIEFNIMLDAEPCSDGELSLAAADFESGFHEVYVNGDFLGYIPSQVPWEVFLYQVPQGSLKQGANLVEIEVIRDCGYIAWGAIEVEPCEEVEFVPEPGSMLLLGSGLAGLAGYATLRWRSRE